MDLKEVMDQKTFAVLGNTLNPDKYAYGIKMQMKAAGYTVYAVGRELPSLNDIEEDIDVIDLCINPVRGLELLKENKKSFKCIVIQPGAADEALLQWLDQQKLPYIHGCLLAGLARYKY